MFLTTHQNARCQYIIHFFFFFFSENFKSWHSSRSVLNNGSMSSEASSCRKMALTPTGALTPLRLPPEDGRFLGTLAGHDRRLDPDAVADRDYRHRVTRGAAGYQ